VLVILLDDVGFGASSAFGGPCQTPTAERLAQAGSSTTASTPRALLADARGDAVGPQPSRGRHGRHHRDRDVGAGYNSLRPNTCAPLAESPETQRLLDGAVRQVP
jgi:arylsulfatase